MVEEEDSLAPVRSVDQSEILDHLQNIVVQGAALSRYFWPTKDKRKPTWREHHERGLKLRGALALTEASPLKSRALRNAIEHFDERLDIYLQSGIVGTILPEYVGFLPKEGGVPLHLFRAYYVDIGVFQLLDERIKIPELAEEINRVHEALELADKNGGRLTGPG